MDSRGPDGPPEPPPPAAPPAGPGAGMRISDDEMRFLAALADGPQALDVYYGDRADSDLPAGLGAHWCPDGQPDAPERQRSQLPPAPAAASIGEGGPSPCSPPQLQVDSSQEMDDFHLALLAREEARSAMAAGGAAAPASSVAAGSMPPPPTPPSRKRALAPDASSDDEDYFGRLSAALTVHDAEKFGPRPGPGPAPEGSTTPPARATLHRHDSIPPGQDVMLLAPTAPFPRAAPAAALRGPFSDLFPRCEDPAAAALELSQRHAEARASPAFAGLQPWVVEAHAVSHWRHLLLLSMNSLERERMEALPIPVMEAILMAAMVCPTLWEALPTVVLHTALAWPLLRAECGRRVRELQARRILFVVVISGCDGVGTPLLALANALRLLRLDEQMPFDLQVVCAMSYEVDPDCLQLGTLVNQSVLGFPVEHLGDLQGAVERTGNMPKWILDLEPIGIALAGTPCTATSIAQKRHATGAQSALHSEKGRLIFVWHKTVHALRNVLGPTKVVSVSEFPSTSSQADSVQLDKLMGRPCIVNAKDWGRAVRHRHFRCDPFHGATAKPLLSLDMTQPRAPLVDGSFWDPQGLGSAPDGVPLTLRRFVQCLYEYQSKNSRTFSEYEQKSLDCFWVRLPAGERRRAGPAFFIEHMGFRNSPLSRMPELYPCHGTVDIQTFTSPGEVPARSQPCGACVLCENCARITQVCGQAWELASATEVCARTLRMASSVWAGTESNAAFRSWCEEPHDCGQHCAMAPGW